MEFITKELDDYVCAHTENEPAVLHELNRQTNISVMQPRMLSGHYQGRVLSMLSHMIQPSRILEIGTYTGYSAICLAEGLKEGGRLITIDKNEELEDFVKEYISKSNNENRITTIIGDAIEVIPTLSGEFDIVFIDADKSNYINYYHLVFDKVRQGGYIFIDNVLWSGKVLTEVDKKDKATRTLVELNKLIHDDSRVQEVLLPIRDGLTIVRKK